jgi:ABC-2 type transport system ATP-binding protein
MDYVLELHDVTKKYDGFTLNKVNLVLPTGSIMGFVGENGAGKSTTIKLILDLIKKDSGSIQLFQDDYQKLSLDHKEDIGVVMDDSCFPEVLTATQIGKLSARLYKHWDHAAYHNYLERFHLPEKKEIKDYSKGMKMKLNIACALSHKAKLLILDEATSGLDPVIRDEILDIFLEFIQDDSHSILMSSHITSDLEKICDYITLIHKGSIVFTKTKDELLDTYGIVKCSETDMRNLPSKAVVCYRKNQFGVEVLVYKQLITSRLMIDPASIEDIMLFYIRGTKL